MVWVVDAALIPSTESTRRLPLAPLKALFLLFPVWYFAGFGALVWIAAAYVMVLVLIFEPDIATPPGLELWLLFVGWMLLSGLQVDTSTRLQVFAYRAAIYGAATVLFLYVYNTPRELAHRVAGIIGGFFAIVVVGGYLGVFFPGFGLRTIAERVLPQNLSSNSWAEALIHVHFAQVQTLVYGQPPVVRPDAPFAYTNEWGAVFSLTAPFAVATALWASAGIRRIAMRVILAASLVPLTLSGNRGAWVAIVVAMLYLALRLAAAGRLRLLLAIVFVALAGLAVATLTSLGSTIKTRADHGQSNEGRISIYAETLTGVAESPVFGHGAPQRQSSNPNLPAAGTHGQLWDTLYSQGIPGAVMYCGLLTLVVWRTRRYRTGLGLCMHVTMVMALVEILFYDQLPSELQVVMVAAALGLAENCRSAAWGRSAAAAELAGSSAWP